ncbi:MAG TPA: fibronectin type III domain-containing protein [Candidatus Angelobacter sp.]
MNVTGTNRGKCFQLQVLGIFLLSVFTLITAASGQTTINPTTATTQLAGTPDPQSPITAPSGGVILFGTAISTVTNRPVRHLWIADNAQGICRVDPDLDSPGPYAINEAICPISGLPGFNGGALAFDSTNNLIYLVDAQAKNSLGVLRVNYHPEFDSGNGSLDAATLFSLGGAPAGKLFQGGQTGCALPGNPGSPNSIAIDPLGNVWVGFSKSSVIERFNTPAAATSSNFGTCAQFVQQAATVAGNHAGSGLAFVGHDLWGATLEIMFVIKNADTICLVGQNPACGSANGTAQITLGTLLGATSITSDQVYPSTNGNNLYIGDANSVAWVGNVVAGSTGQTLAPTYVATTNGLANVGAVIVDGTDPANLVLFAGDDPSGAGTQAAGRVFQTTQTAAAPGPPGAPLNVVASIASGQGTVTWSPLQTGQPVTSYTVHNNFASNGTPLADITVSPVGSAFPATSTVLNGIAAGATYQFQVEANNAQGSSAFSAPSNLAPVIPIPDPPTGVQALAGDTQAAVSWTVPLNNGGATIVSYTVTTLVNGNPTGNTVTVPAPSSGTAVSAVVSGLANNTSYTFTVHASNPQANSQESAPSTPATPSISNVPIMKVEVNGPISVTPVPAVVTYTVVVTNTSQFAVNGIQVNHTLATTDGAFIIVAEPGQGVCTAGGSGVTAVVCSVGNMAPGAVVNIDVVVQMQRAQIDLSSRVTGFDANGDSLVFKLEHRTTTPPGTPPPAGSVSIPVPVTGQATPASLSPSQAGMLTFSASDNTNTVATDVEFTITIDSGLTINSVTVTPSTGPNAASCNAPQPGLVNTNVITCNIAALGGPKASNPTTSLQVVVGITAPARTGLTFLPSATVNFNGINSANGTSTLNVKVH